MIHFVTYGDSKYCESKKRIEKEAISTNWFDSVNIFGPKDIDSEFAAKFQKVLRMPRGGGYWIWRIDIIKQMMDKVDEGDIIVYADAGCNLNKNGDKRFNEYLEKLENSKNNYGILSFQMHQHKEKTWTTREIFEYFDVSKNEIKESGQYLGGVFFLKKNDHARLYLDKLNECINTNMLLITDVYNRNQDLCFRDNRHDQSISSVLRKIIGSEVIPRDETYVVPFGGEESMNYPIWATRSRN